MEKLPGRQKVNLEVTNSINKCFPKLLLINCRKKKISRIVTIFYFPEIQQRYYCCHCFPFYTEELLWKYTLRKKCPNSKLFWSAFSRVRTEYGEILRISPYSVRMRGNTDQNNSAYGHFSRNDRFITILKESEIKSEYSEPCQTSKQERFQKQLMAKSY